MYEKVDAVLSGNSSDNYFYDDEFMYAQKLISEFTENDWDKLLQNLKDRDDKYKIRLVYCIDEDTGMNGFNLLLDLLNVNDEIAEYVIDSLRSFNNEEYKKIITSNKRIMDKAESLLKRSSLPVKRILEAFLQQNTQS
ncbi:MULTISPECIES: hypothetical protein [Bacillus]|uniref:Immunity protein 30 domain-containing protein n=1 Tax=Bacillus thuringiensis subsp. konkukian (strain 97-27) TaxID=281309 RepID=Q6HE34_BACHK|nr:MULTISPECIES: hypothetical protein [Bacillus]COE16674.1 Uncharacterised protein [Streptococcus pneumoniae]AAT60750.1 conserved hypothetical protein [[Bacillus thuringiensis] serovar konkukian str. 97-27]AJI34291.1 hypothetical protein BG06_3841 [Bacillus thuringiensis]KAB7642610.1 hypothetical protein GBN83_01875 [Bacillus sp. B3-WWTP-C-10-D-3]MCC0758805.1 hypothetical protein [Bacillus sp. BRTN]